VGAAVTVTYSLLSSAVEGEGNIAGVPRFVNLRADDYRLRSGSPGIDVGTLAGAPATDILGRARPQGAGIDMGAYEHVAQDDLDVVDPLPVLRVNAASTATDPDGLTWTTAFPTLQAAADQAGLGTEIWVAQGSYTSENGNVVMLRFGTSLYGGFAGVESGREARSTDNSHVLIDGQGTRRGILASVFSLVDGVTIVNGKGKYGGGMHGGTAVNCAFTDNSASQHGGGLYEGVATNCTFTRNSASYGAGMYKGTATNCTFTGNLATHGGGGIYEGECKNGIVWGNSPSEVAGTDVTFSLLSAGVDGLGNIAGNPVFVNPWADDFRLRSGSPGIDVGMTQGAPATDALGRTRPQGGGVDMGAYEHVAADDLDAVDPVPVLRVDAASTALGPDGLTWATAFPTLQAAADRAAFGTELWVARGVYTSERANVVALLPGTALYGGFAGVETQREQRSADNSLTVIDGQRVRRGIRADGSSIVDGVTILGGRGVELGGGMLHGTAINCTFLGNSANYNGGGMFAGIAINCVFSDNSTSFYGGGMYEGIATNCTFTGNRAGYDGGGMHKGIATNCTFTENVAISDGGGMYRGTATNCTFMKNEANYGGGGMFEGNAKYCTFTGNTAYVGGGMRSGVAINCLFSGNAVAGKWFCDDYGSSGFVCTYSASCGGGMYRGSATNCTFTRNTADNGGGIYLSNNENMITGCILWNNSSSIVGSGPVTYSLVQGGWTGEGIISADPLFVVPPAPGPDGVWGTADDLGDLRLQPGSPCIDAGGPDRTPSVDLAGTLRPQGAAIDMGAYEYVGDSTVLLTLTVEGSGAVVGMPEGVYTVATGTMLTLTAVPEEGRVFIGWEGALHGNGNPAALVMDMDQSIRAVFTGAADSEGAILHVAPFGKRVSANAGTAAIHVSNAGGGSMLWTAAVTSGGEFLSMVSEASGTNSGTILLAFTENTTGVERIGYVTIVAEDAVGSPVEVLISQTGEPAPTPTPGDFTADMDGDGAISLSELIRVISFYNAGGLHCAATPESTEDGYVAGPGADQTCPPHASDYRPDGPSWTIDLLELLRVIQFFNMGGYGYCPEEATEDGFCPAWP
jgi:predicted outer membrane repeat protein